jgi:hypothetical protein
LQKLCDMAVLPAYTHTFFFQTTLYLKQITHLKDLYILTLPHTAFSNVPLLVPCTTWISKPLLLWGFSQCSSVWIKLLIWSCSDILAAFFGVFKYEFIIESNLEIFWVLEVTLCV